MAGSFRRDELYQLVWTRPVREIASGHGVSDVAFAKMPKARCATSVEGILGEDRSGIQNPD